MHDTGILKNATKKDGISLSKSTSSYPARARKRGCTRLCGGISQRPFFHIIEPPAFSQLGIRPPRPDEAEQAAPVIHHSSRMTSVHPRTSVSSSDHLPGCNMWMQTGQLPLLPALPLQARLVGGQVCANGHRSPVSLLLRIDECVGVQNGDVGADPRDRPMFHEEIQHTRGWLSRLPSETGLVASEAWLWVSIQFALRMVCCLR